MHPLIKAIKLSYLSGTLKCLRNNVFKQQRKHVASAEHIDRIVKRASCHGGLFPKIFARSSPYIRRTASFGRVTPKFLTRGPSCFYRPAAYGGLAPKQFTRSSSYFCVHPEKIKQFMKQKDGQTLCHFFDSEDYKRKAADKLEQQKKLIIDGTPKDVNEADVSYEHILSCAQPKRKPKVIVQPGQEDDTPVPGKSLKKHFTGVVPSVLEKGTAGGKLLPFHKALIENAIYTAAVDNLNKTDTKKKYRKRSTILPIYLKKIEQNIAKKKKHELLQQSKIGAQEGAKRFSIGGRINVQNQVNLRKFDSTIGKAKKEDESDNVGVSKPKPKGQYVARNLTTLVHKPKLPVYSDDLKTRQENISLLTESKLQQNEDEEADSTSPSARQVQIHPDYALTVTPKSAPAVSKPPTTMSDKEPPAKDAEEKSSWKRKKLRPIQNFKKMEELTKSCELNLPADSNAEFELDNNATDPDLNKVGRRNMSTFRLKERTKEDMVDQVLTLFDRVKIDSVSKMRVETDGDQHSVEGSMDRRQFLREPSLTYQLVNSSRRRREIALKAQYNIVPNMGKKNMSTDTSRNLLRLPKTTPEGYRVLLYSVKDNDPTKMNFSDCIKGFCMYNDCVLSEDGLQEGYVVIFDMKGVQLGHLARVSLPALRCFLLYIQEAHPCRLKAIHILNTATWIHHIMRLVVPLVKSELLNLVKFHKGNIPDGLPIDLLPMDYGGETSTVEELNKETKAMMQKYHQWLVESAEFKSDESKRVRKASWWGFFNGTNKTSTVELDEKTILKNLQID